MSVMPAPIDPPSAAPAQSPVTTQQHHEKHEEKHKNIGNYEVLKTVGEGSFAKVKLAVHRLTKQKVALKIIDKDKLPDEYSLKNIHREAQIMRLLDHPNIIQLYEVMETKKELYLVLEYAVGGELLDYIVARGRLHEKEARRFFQQITSALEYCHQLNIVHRDLKAENLLLDENCNIKITDFGLSNVFDRAKNLVTCCGSPVYSAPELIEGKKYTGPEVDCWSLGINLYAMVVGDLPFADSNLTALYNSILKGVYHLPDFVSAECRDLISKLLERHPEKRLTITQAREHTWVNHGISLLENTQVVKTRPKLEAELDMELVDQIQLMGFERNAAIASILGGKFNQAAGTYYLMAAQKRNEAEKRVKIARDQQVQAAKVAAAAAAAAQPKTPKLPELESLRAQIENERQRTKPGEQNQALNDIILEYEKRKAELQDLKSQSKPNIANPRQRGGNPAVSNKSQIAPASILPAGYIGAGLVPLPKQNAKGAIEIGNALLQQQAAFLVPSTPPESKGAALTAGPLADMMYAAHAGGEQQYKGQSGLAAPLQPDSTAVSNASIDKNKTPRRRNNSVKAPIPIDATLYLDPLQDEDGRDPSFPDIRTIRFAFNCQTTTSLTPDIMMERLKKVLDQNDVQYRFEFYLSECEWGDIKFEVEICKLPRMKTYGLRLKRNAGDMWDYKRLSGKISAELEL
ncbi:MAP microtubule affinity-regulating kinase 1 [Podochytrium sp. JEL0797]|nr:MAP microtubule affinity-regulating kinase 1 [Podochytrium sp. JEL0797]